MLLKSEILDAQSKCQSAAECARYLKVSYPTYKKWAKFHGVFENLINQPGRGISKNTQRKTIEHYIKGEKDHQNPKTYLEQLVRYGYKKECCERCGYDDKRLDGKVPLLIHFRDGNKYNSKLENIEILCYNCYYIKVGVELIGRKTRRYWTTDYFSKYNEEDYSKYNDFEYDDFNMEDINAKIDRAENDKKEDIDELFKKLNN